MGDTKKRNQKHIFDDDHIEQKNAGKRKHSKIREYDDDLDLEEDESPYLDLIDDHMMQRIK